MDIKYYANKAKQFKRFDYMVNGKSVKAGYDTANEHFLSLTEDQVKQLDERWKATKKFNNEVSLHNRDLFNKAVEDLEQFFDIMGLDTWKKSKYGKHLGEYKEFKLFLKKLTNVIPTCDSQAHARFFSVKVNEEEMSTGFSPCDLVTLHRVINTKLEDKRKLELQNNKLYIEAVKACEQFDIKAEQFQAKELIAKVTELAKDKWFNSAYPDGTEMDIDCCDECDTHIMGERRCSCGNVRVSYNIEGDLLTGFFAYDERY